MAKKDQMYVAKDTGQIEIDGALYDFYKDKTFINGDHPIMGRKGWENLFEPVENRWSGVESATAAPGERRAAPVHEPSKIGNQTAEQHARAAAKKVAQKAKVQEAAPESEEPNDDSVKNEDTKD